MTPATLPGERVGVLNRRLCVLVTSALCREDPVQVTAAALRGGADVVQLREKAMPGTELTALATKLASLCRERGALFVVNDRPRVAAASGAGGVHVGQEDASVAEARSCLPPGAVVGVSTHDGAELDAALRDGADYVGVGAVFATSTKGRAVPVGGPGRLAPLAARAEAAGVPAFAIGGIDEGNVGEVVRAGFTRIAVCGAVLRSDDPERVCRALRTALDAASSGR